MWLLHRGSVSFEELPRVTLLDVLRGTGPRECITKVCKKTDNQSLKHKEKQMFELALKLLQSNNTGE